MKLRQWWGTPTFVLVQRGVGPKRAMLNLEDEL
jgi:hypothetical protein